MLGSSGVSSGRSGRYLPVNSTGHFHQPTRSVWDLRSDRRRLTKLSVSMSDCLCSQMVNQLKLKSTWLLLILVKEWANSSPYLYYMCVRSFWILIHSFLFYLSNFLHPQLRVIILSSSNISDPMSRKRMYIYKFMCFCQWIIRWLVTASSNKINIKDAHFQGFICRQKSLVVSKNI